MKQYFKYFKYVFKHKFWVMKYCFEDRLYIRGILHDINKFRPSNFIAYANYFYL